MAKGSNKGRLMHIDFWCSEGSRNVLDFKTILDMKAKSIDLNFVDGFGIILNG
jgi:hypothetical protein